MQQAIVSAIVSAVLGGVFALIGKWMEVRSLRPIAAGNVEMPATVGAVPGPAPAPATAPSVNVGAVFIHIGLLQLVINLIGFAIGFGLSATGVSDAATILVAALIVGTVSLIVGFAIIGARVNRAVRWQHLVYVALGTAVVTLALNSALLGQPISALDVGVALAQTFVAAGIGGLIATAISR